MIVHSDHYSFNGATSVLAKDTKGKESNRALSKLTQEEKIFFLY